MTETGRNQKSDNILSYEYVYLPNVLDHFTSVIGIHAPTALLHIDWLQSHSRTESHGLHYTTKQREIGADELINSKAQSLSWEADCRSAGQEILHLL
jgi:hypothetical protein